MSGCAIADPLGQSASGPGSATEASLRQRIETLRAENQPLRDENANLKTGLAIAYGQQRQVINA